MITMETFPAQSQVHALVELQRRLPMLVIVHN
jgi:hypothetical protein